jgi:hypothetical protein
LLALALASAGCSDPRAAAEARLAEVGAESVRRDAALLYKDLFSGRSPEFQIVRRRDWPKSFQRLEPLRVGAYVDGFSLAIHADADSEAGLYIVPLHMSHQPSGAARARFQPLAEGIYWYVFEE